MLLNERFAQMEKVKTEKVKSDHPPTEESGEKASPFCSFIGLTPLVICLPAGNMLVTSVLLFTCLLIVIFVQNCSKILKPQGPFSCVNLSHRGTKQFEHAEGN